MGKTDAAAFSDKVLIIIDNCNSDDGIFLFTVEHSTGEAAILITTRLGTIGDYEDLSTLREKLESKCHIKVYMYDKSELYIISKLQKKL